MTFLTNIEHTKISPKVITISPDDDIPPFRFEAKVPDITPKIPKQQAKIIMKLSCFENRNEVAAGTAIKAITNIAPTDSKAATHVSDNNAMIP